MRRCATTRSSTTTAWCPTRSCPRPRRTRTATRSASSRTCSPRRGSRSSRLPAEHPTYSTSNDDTLSGVMLAVTSDPPAAGAELGQVVIATGGALLMTAILVWLGTAYRGGRGGVLEWVDRTSRSIGGLPGWSGAPALLALLTLVPALFGL